ncbi:hypothetical protein LTR15_007735 [Elasticomyces elasticus]|nr:hypothetical protein LTR15_007735 [Elasticomyces elasticus]
MDSDTMDDLPMSRESQVAVGGVKVKETDTEKTHHSLGSEVCKPTAEGMDTNDMAETQNASETPGLLTIAAELRNKIYELVFASDDTEVVYLLTARPPSKALVLVSRQTYEEAKQMYNKVYQEYWSLTTFYIDYNDYSSKQVTVDHCTAADLANIRNLLIKMTSTQLERRVGSLASELVKGSSAIMFARQSDKRWWPSTEMYTTSGYILRWETRGSYRNLGYERYDRAYYEQSKVFSPISLQEISALGGRLFVMK